MSNPIAQNLNSYLSQFNVLVKFLDPVIHDDLPHYDRGQVIDILTAIVKRFEDNGNPHQVVEKWKLKGDLFGYFKIRLKAQMIRIVYKVEESPDQTLVTIVVIGPKKNEEAYKTAKKRIAKFSE
jgi:Txe/YoeB family toxin of Txe-Axe toxin-antitoxin module